MENASKALLIAAGVIISGLIISLLVLSYSRISSYYAEKHNMTEAEQLEKFNSEYMNYQGSEIRGNELISIMNKIIDYNILYANDKGFSRIILNVDLKGYAKELSFDGDATLFKKDPISNKSNDSEIKRIAELPIKLTKEAEDNGITGITDLKLQKLSSEISNICLGNKANEEAKIQRARKLTQILGTKIDKDTNIDNIIDATLKYYQLTQFKRTMFKCKEVSVSRDTGRVNKMIFEAIVTSEGKLKMD